MSTASEGIGRRSHAHLPPDTCAIRVISAIAAAEIIMGVRWTTVLPKSTCQAITNTNAIAAHLAA
jgi:hypothetical protein